MNKNEFKKLNYCLELLAIKDIISNKKSLLKYKLFSCYSEEELNKFIKLVEKRKDLFKNIIKEEIKLNYNEAIKFGKENKEKYIRLYNLNYMNQHNSTLDYIRNSYDQYLDLVEKVYKKEAKEIFEELVQEQGGVKKIMEAKDLEEKLKKKYGSKLA